MIKIFKCGLCKNNQYVGTRKGLRNHLKEKHSITKEITNFGEKKTRQSHWLVEDFK